MKNLKKNSILQKNKQPLLNTFKFLKNFKTLSSFTKPLAIKKTKENRCFLSFSSKKTEQKHQKNKNKQKLAPNLVPAGVLIGHKTLKKKSAWHSSMFSYSLGTRNQNCILNAENLVENTSRAVYIITKILRSQGFLLLINTNGEFSGLLKQFLNLLSVSSGKNFRKTIGFIDCKWVGGLLTNWQNISHCVKKFTKFSQRFDNYILQNSIHLPRYKKWKTFFQGLQNTILVEKKRYQKRHSSLKAIDNYYSLSAFNKPSLVFIFNPNENLTIIQEAYKLHIPVVAITDSNTDLTYITYPIPANNHSVFFVWYFLKFFLQSSLLCKTQ
jgi:small subunit ribosomal protein S2